MTDVDKKLWAEVLRNEARSLKLTLNHITTLADRLDPPGDMPEPSRSGHYS